MLSREMGFSSYMSHLRWLAAEKPHQCVQRIVVLVHHTLLERNDRVVRDRDTLRTHLGAALGDVAVADAVSLLQLLRPVHGIEGMHLQRRDIRQEPRTDEGIMLCMIPQNMTHVLAEVALDALPEFLHTIDVHLGHAPRSVSRVRRARRELRDLLLYLEVPRDVGHQVAHQWKRAHRLYRYRLGQIEVVQPRHAHQLRHAVHFSGARSAFAGLAVPAHREVVRAFRLYLMDGVEHDHAFGDCRRIALELPARRVPAPHVERRLARLAAGAGVTSLGRALSALDDPALYARRHLFSSMICLRSDRISGIGRCVTRMFPSSPRSTAMLNAPNFGSFSGKSS